jgi:polyisoprenoid-binding protein YceI
MTVQAVTSPIRFLPSFPPASASAQSSPIPAIRNAVSISIVRDGELAVEGDLTIHGVTRKVVFTVEDLQPPTKDPWGNIRVAVSGTTKINRKDYGLTWNAALETGGILVGEEITITLQVEFVKA